MKGPGDKERGDGYGGLPICTYAFKSPPAQKVRPSPVTTTTLEEGKCLKGSLPFLSDRTYHREGSSSNQAKIEVISVVSWGVIALRCLGRLRAIRMTCSWGKETLSASE